MFKEFREFIARGNVLDLAVGIIIGAAFTAVVNSMVNDLINPIIGLLTGRGTDFSNLFFAVSTESFPTVAAAEAAGVAVFRYGSFMTAVINFLVIAWVVFLLVKAVNKARAMAIAEKEVKQPEDPIDIKLLKEIRDELKAHRPPEAIPAAPLV